MAFQHVSLGSEYVPYSLGSESQGMILACVKAEIRFYQEIIQTCPQTFMLRSSGLVPHSSGVSAVGQNDV